MKKNRSSFGQIRIIGGQFRGHKLSLVNSKELRPTTNIARETLFNWLSPFIFQSKCLDCFAGSGALGLEAISRNAASATFLEIKKLTANQLKKNIFKLNANNSKVININAFSYLSKPGIPQDIVFVDPPFRKKDFLEKTLILLKKNGWLKKNSFLYIESEVEKNSLKLPDNLELYRKKLSNRYLYRLYYCK